jgi:hypothetical protein
MDKGENMEIDEGSPGQDEEPAFGTKFTIDLGDVELTEEEIGAIMSDITNAALERARSRLPPGSSIVARFARGSFFSRLV